ncbi:hypothetical protein Tco_1410915 [Tanacetum coccineum]
MVATTYKYNSTDKGKRTSWLKNFEDEEERSSPSFDEQEAIRLQAQFDEEEMIVREKEEVNAALIAQWMNIKD